MIYVIIDTFSFIEVVVVFLIINSLEKIIYESQIMFMHQRVANTILHAELKNNNASLVITFILQYDFRLINSIK